MSRTFFEWLFFFFALSHTDYQLQTKGKPNRSIYAMVIFCLCFSCVCIYIHIYHFSNDHRSSSLSSWSIWWSEILNYYHEKLNSIHWKRSFFVHFVSFRFVMVFPSQFFSSLIFNVRSQSMDIYVNAYVNVKMVCAITSPIEIVFDSKANIWCEISFEFV